MLAADVHPYHFCDVSVFALACSVFSSSRYFRPLLIYCGSSAVDRFDYNCRMLPYSYHLSKHASARAET